MINNIRGDDLLNVQRTISYNTTSAIPHSAEPGTVWFDGHQMRVFTGGGWEEIRGETVYLQCDPQLKKVVAWAEKKMADEAREAELQEKFPALKQAKNNYNLIRKMVAE